MAGSVTAYLGLGGNLGDRLAALTEALALLDAAPGMRRIACSSVYETEPWGVTDQPRFLNLVVGFDTTLLPTELLALCQSVERKVGRTATYRWGPRLIDIDVLLYGNETVSMTTPDLQIPHPRMQERAFVMVPLAEIAPDLVIPSGVIPVRDLLDELDGREGVTPWVSPP